MEASRSWSDRRTELGRTALGGSDAAAVLGVNPFKTAFDVWLRVTGRMQPEDITSQAAEWGTRLESEVLRKYAEGLEPPFALIGRDRDGHVSMYQMVDGELEIVKCRARWGWLFETLRHPDHPHLMAHIDGVVINAEDDGIRNLVEAKTTGHWRAQSDDWGDADSDEIPPEYIVQVHHYAGLLDKVAKRNVGYADIPVLKAGQNYEVYTVPIDPELVDTITAQLNDWWAAHVESDIAPPVTAKDGPSLSLLYPEDDGQSIPAPSDLSVSAGALGNARDTVSRFKSEQSTHEAQIKAAMGDASEIVGDDWRCTWKQSKAGAKTDWKAVVDDIREAVDLDVRVTAEVLDGITRDRTEVKPGSRRFLPYGIAKGAK